jgi:hypothetical protein
VRRTFLSAAAILAFTASGNADELSDIQAQSEQFREQNQASAFEVYTPLTFLNVQN